MNEGKFHTFGPGSGSVTAGAIQKSAAQWLALRQARGLTLAEVADFADWRAQDPRHDAVYSEVEAAWGAFDALAKYPHSLDVTPDPDLLARPRRVSRFMAPSLLAAAAAISLLAVVHFTDPWSGRPAGSAAIAHVEPGIVRLSDGSEVEVHAGSEMVEQFTPGERRVQLVRGEAYFAVARDSARPFVVEAGGVAVRAVGTAFNVRLRPDATSVEVLVTEGKVQITPPNSRERKVDPGMPPGALQPPVDLVPRFDIDAAILTAGQRTVISTRAGPGPATPIIETLAAADIDRALSWQTGRLILDATPLAEAVERFNRHAVGRQTLPRLTITDPRLRTMRISGRIRAENIESFVEVLESNFDVVADRGVPGEIILRRR